MKTELRLKAVTEETLNVQKNGYTKPAGGSGLQSVKEEADEIDQLQDISNPGSPEVKRKSNRTRSLPAD